MADYPLDKGTLDQKLTHDPNVKKGGTILDQLTDALFGAGHGTTMHAGKTVDQTVDEAVKGAPGSGDY